MKPETILEATGSGVEAESHPTLFRQFLKTLGVTEAEIPEVAGTAGAGPLRADAAMGFTATTTRRARRRLNRALKG
jgi:hypothetical protein